MPSASNVPLSRVPSPRMLLLAVAVVVAGFVVPRFFPSISVSPSAPAPSPAPDYAGFLLKMSAGTLIFAGVCFLVARKSKPASPVVPSSLEILATLPIASRGVVHLVRAGQRRLLLGVDLHGVKTITELPGPMPEAIIGPVRLTTEAV